MPTAANLNLYRRWNSCVGWHCDDEPLIGECGEAKLIVSVSFGTHALSSWKGKSCPDGEANSCCLDHGDILVMDGQCQDRFLHCTSPGLEQDRINVTFRWIKQHAPSCSFLRAGVVCCLPTCAQGSSVPVTGMVGDGSFGAFWVLLGALCIWGVLAWLVYPSVCTWLGLQRCTFCWTRPLGGGRWRRYLCNLWGVFWTAHKTAKYLFETGGSSICGMLASAGQPSLHGYYHAGKNDYLPFFFEGLITEFGNNYWNRFFPWGPIF